MINDVVNSGIKPAVNAKVSAATTAPAVESVKPESTTPETIATPDKSALNQAVSKLNDHVQNIRRTLSFSISETTGRTIIEVYDSETDELIRQIPPEQTVKLAENLAEIIDPGFFIKERA
jgi:flagellar protein FlaG